MSSPLHAVIRPAEPADAALLSELGALTFIEAYEHLCQRSDLDAYIALHYDPERLYGELGTSHIFTWLAHCEGQAVGFLQLADVAAPLDIRGRRPLKLWRLYLRKDTWGQSLGRRFMELALRVAEQRGHDSLWLSVWEKNPRAMRFYERWGFEDVGWEIFPTGEERSIDRLLELRITPSSSEFAK